MQARELTPDEVREGEHNINDTQLTATQIQALVRQMDTSKAKHKRLPKAEYEAAVKAENQTLYFNYPSLYQMHIEERLDQTFFEMLNLKRKIERGEMTSEQASAVVGQQLFNRFIPHAISNSAPPVARMSYEDYYRQSRE